MTTRRSNAAVFAWTTSGFLVGATLSWLWVRRYYEKRSKKRETELRSRTTEDSPSVAGDGFLTDLIHGLWPHVKIAAANMITEMMYETFAELPKPLCTLKITNMDLGKVPLRLENVIVHAILSSHSNHNHNNNENFSIDSLQFDMDVVWNSECDIQLKADYVGGFGVRDFTLSGRMSLIFKPLTDRMPCFTAIQYAFINAPHLELDFTGLAQVADFALIDQTIRRKIMNTLCDMVVLPRRKIYKMDTANDYFRSYIPPLGVLHVTVVSGRGFAIEQLLLRNVDIPDVYCNIRFGGRTCRTSTVKNHQCPDWNESFDFVLCDHEQVLEVHAWDENASPLDPDDDLGIGKLSVAELWQQPGKTKEVDLLDSKTNNATGSFVTLKCDVLSFTSSDLFTLENPFSNPNRLCGILTMLVSRAFDLPGRKEDAASYVKVSIGKHNIRGSAAPKPSDTSLTFLTKTVTNYPGLDPLNPLYDAQFHVPLTSKIVEANNDIVFSLINGDAVLGTRTFSIALLKDVEHCTLLETYPMGASARLEYKVMLHAVQLRNDDITREESEDTQETPTSETKEMVQVTLVKGYGFVEQNRKRGGFFRKMDIPDVYCCVKVGSNEPQWRTSTVRNTTLPLWNESNVFSIVDRGDIIEIDVYDESKKKSDEYIGSCSFPIDAVLTAGGVLETQLRNQDCNTGAYVVIQCKILD